MVLAFTRSLNEWTEKLVFSDYLVQQGRSSYGQVPSPLAFQTIYFIFSKTCLRVHPLARQAIE